MSAPIKSHFATFKISGPVKAKISKSSKTLQKHFKTPSNSSGSEKSHKKEISFSPPNLTKSCRSGSVKSRLATFKISGAGLAKNLKNGQNSTKVLRDIFKQPWQSKITSNRILNFHAQISANSAGPRLQNLIWLHSRSQGL